MFEKQRKRSDKIKIIKKNNINNQLETKILKLNANKPKKILNWKIKYSLQETTSNILKWNKLIKKKSYFDVCMILVKDYINK